MRVLVACERSGAVRRAFRALGHDAWSNDIVPADDGSPYHIVADAAEVAYSGGWDLMIAHPMCTFLANSGAKWLYLGGREENGPDPARWANMDRGARFYLKLYHAPINRKCIENPIMHKHGAKIIGHRATQFIQPWMFGHGEVKASGLDLVNLPKLVPTKIVEGRVPRVHFASPGPDRQRLRSETLPGIASAMASQWGCL